MNIVHVITGLEDGGAEAVLFRLLTHDHANQHIVVSLTGAGKYGPLLLDAGIAVHALDMPRGRLSLRGLRKLGALLLAERPEAVQTWMYHGNLVGGVAAKLAGIKIFWGIHHTMLVAGTTGSSTRIVDWLCARLSRLVPTNIVACAQQARVAHVTNGYHSEKFAVIPNGYDISIFAPDPKARVRIRAELDIPDHASVIGLVGRWDPLKDHANLVAAARLVGERAAGLHLVLVGTGCDEDNRNLAVLLAESGADVTVHLLGRRSDVPAIMNALDLHVLSSAQEAFPNVVAEAMACGTPSVVTDVGDAALIVGNTGWVVPRRNPTALAEAIAAALSERANTDTWSERQRAARQRIVDEFSLETMVERYRKIWASAD